MPQDMVYGLQETLSRLSLEDCLPMQLVTFTILWHRGEYCIPIGYTISIYQGIQLIGLRKQWVFIIFGVVTFAWSIILILFLPDSPLTASFLKSSQREYAFRRPQKDQHTYKSKEWGKEQFVEAIIDPKTWLISIATFCTSVPNGGLTSVSPELIYSFREEPS